MGLTNQFYTYQDLDAALTWLVIKVEEGKAEKVDDAKRLQFGRKRLPEPIKPMWRFKTKLATDFDYTDYMAKSLIIGQEIEADFKDVNHPVSDSTISRAFGIHPTEYHHTPNCPVCGLSECWNHLPDNLIRGIERDASIEGWEFLIYGSHLSSEDFAKRLPLAKLREYFTINERDGLHVHAMIVHDIAKLPLVIVKNLWQLFRYYYPAWVNLFGNYQASQGFLRHSSYNGHDYVNFTSFSKSPFNKRWAADVKTARCALYLFQTPIENEDLNAFDIEIRTPDGSFDLEQLIALRALTKAMILRAAQLSNFGLISVESNEKTWENVKRVVSRINIRSGIDDEDIAFMKAHTIAMFREFSPFLSDFERTCIKNLIAKPVREREGRPVTAEDLHLELSETAKNLKKFITVTSIEAENEEAWFNQAAHLLGTPADELKTAIRQLKAYFNKDTNTMVVVG